jgi:sporulation protein YlmC with PRC-barrel domain
VLAKASDLIGQSVMNADGENIGEVQDLMADMGQSRVEHVVLSFDDFLGLEDQLYAIPMAALQINTDVDEAQTVRLVLDVPPEMLQAAPGFDPNEYPDPADPAWDAELRSYWEFEE